MTDISDVCEYGVTHHDICPCRKDLQMRYSLVVSELEKTRKELGGIREKLLIAQAEFNAMSANAVSLETEKLRVMNLHRTQRVTLDITINAESCTLERATFVRCENIRNEIVP